MSESAPPAPPQPEAPVAAAGSAAGLVAGGGDPTADGLVDERQPEFESAAAQQAFHSAVLAQLQAPASGGAPLVDPATLVTADVALHRHPTDQTNAHAIRCRYCPSKVLLAGAGAYESRAHQLHALGGSKSAADSRETLTDWWVVPSQMNFENVAVTRAVDPAYRYLTCCDCERGPIGINYLAEPNKFFIAHARVRYDHPQA